MSQIGLLVNPLHARMTRFQASTQDDAQTTERGQTMITVPIRLYVETHDEQHISWLQQHKTPCRRWSQRHQNSPFVEIPNAV